MKMRKKTTSKSAWNATATTHPLHIPYRARDSFAHTFTAIKEKKTSDTIKAPCARVHRIKRDKQTKTTQARKSHTIQKKTHRAHTIMRKLQRSRDYHIYKWVCDLWQTFSRRLNIIERTTLLRLRENWKLNKNTTISLTDQLKIG